MKVKIKDGSKRKKFLHDLSHDVSTTLDFGFCQPIMCREVSAQDTVQLSIPQFVRLGVVVKPTFGRLHLRTYNKFVPIESVYHPYGSFIAGQSFSHGGESYIPDQVSNISLQHLSKLVALCADVVVFSGEFQQAGTDLDASRLVVEDIVGDYEGIDIITYIMFGPDYPTQELADELEYCSATKVLGRTDFDGLYEDGRDPKYNLSYYDWYFYTTFRGNRCLICGRLNRGGRNLLSVLKGCGYQFDLGSGSSVSILPLFAYYKSYFELFNPHRDLTFKDTFMYRCMEYMEYTGNFNVSSVIAGQSPKHVLNFHKFLYEELSLCYYTQNPDYASAHISGTALPIATSESIRSNEVIDGQGDENSLSSDSRLDNVSLDGYEVQSINRSVLRLLDIVSKRINVHTAIGGRIKEYLRSVFGAQYLEDERVDFLGSQNVDIDISDVMSFAETEQGALGEYAGKGVGYMSEDGAEKMSFTAPTVGFVVSFMCIVPEARMSQGVDPLLFHIDPKDFFDADFDGITLLPTLKQAIYGLHESNIGSFVGSFGNIPVYTEYKIANNVLNGDFSRPSSRESFLPFTLDKLLPFQRVLEVGGDGADRTQFITSVSNVVITNGTVWRYIGKDRWLGNYDRIFLGSGAEEELPGATGIKAFYMDRGFNDDNFIVHCRINMKVHSFALPLSESFDTGSFDGASMEVEKA